ncbi:MAG TPA: hypothetical protein VK470_05810 [Bacteroidota bacterium]|nr:hypothetical protein [Bacteroidota bacterium]
MKTLVTILLVMLIGTTAFSGDIIKRGSLRAESKANITVYWESADESNVKEFGVERSSLSGGDFILVSTVKAKGSNSSYQYVDQSAFKTTASMYKYRIRIVDLNASISYSDEIKVNYDVSGVKRTWGSLKAMFR